ncbi:probable cation-transporting ATPase 13A3 isoform X3 [Limulus polyphemus]|uniref:Probable cation-transporting ATPase 13A3 isoform X3 n=1 Tax=Limulus polyphemus TaxID=6850 RepID=A0ABM1BGW3_LIMPO|nr:probable cation-transporting ATPase 13A3 isoform X3 [Limulus polyphemus]
MPTELVSISSQQSVGNQQTETVFLNLNKAACFRYFIHRCVKYVWDQNKKGFKRLRGFDEGLSCGDFHEKFHGYSTARQRELREFYGENTIDIEVKSYWRLFIEEQRITLRNMVAHSNAVTVTVCRQNGSLEDIPASQLVPGDLIVIPPNGCLMACDAVLVAGNCIVNESMLTGESVPETKTPVSRQEDNEVYSPQNHKRHTLFCGTHVIQSRYYGHDQVLGVVIRTGFLTAKGELVRSILFPKPLGFKFYQDSMKFILVLFCISAIGMAYSLYLYIHRHASVSKAILRVLDIVTIVVPPALPAAMTVGTVYAQNRLKKSGIFCISPPRINIGGKLKLICFDKTGTLTEEGLDLWGVIEAKSGRFQNLIHDPTHLSVENKLLATMATCHSLTMIEGELTGDPLDLKMFAATKWEFDEPGYETTRYDMLMPTVVHPPVHQLKLEHSSTSLQPNSCVCSLSAQLFTEPGKDTSRYDTLTPIMVKPVQHEMYDSAVETKVPYEIGIVRQFPFSSSAQRMGVICRTLGKPHMDLYVKGAPEKIASLCLKQTLPENFSSLLQDYTLQGFRVIALAWRKLDRKLTWHHAQRVKRDQIEFDLTFLGLLVMQNTLKPETTPVIEVLQQAKIRTVMVTGDNILTAVSVARDCGLIPRSDNIILVSGLPPDDVNRACIDWQYAESPHIDLEEEDEPSVPVSHQQKLNINEENKGDQTFHFAIDGRSFAVVRQYFPEVFLRLIVRGTVFARMAPDQKAQLVESLQDIGYIVSMCGDGANDCGALKAADVGISLSEAEASVAAPFTSKIPNIECVPIVIREGRCALVTSFSMFRFIALYSLIQFFSVLILYNRFSNLSDFMFLYIDLGIITTLAIVMSYTAAYEKLVAKRPQGSMVSLSNIISLVLQILLVGGIQLAALMLLEYQHWYKRVSFGPQEETLMCWESTTIFLISSFQYLIVAVVFSKGPPYRKSLFSNFYFMGALFLLTGFTLLLLFSPFKKLNAFFKLVLWNPHEKLKFRLMLLVLAVGNFILCFIAQVCIAESQWLKKVTRLIKQKKEPKNRYRLVEKELESLPDWPVINEKLYASDYSVVFH